MRRVIIGAVAAAAVFASAAPPAHATHDAICTPPDGRTPICITGVEHRVGEARKQTWDFWWATYLPLWTVLFEQYGTLDQVPDPVCLPTHPVCLSGHRQVLQYYYGGALWAAIVVPAIALCYPTGQCSLP